MTTRPARVVASLLLIASGSVVAVTALAIVIAKLLVDAGMAVTPGDAALLADLLGILPLVVGFAVITLVAAAGLLLGASWAPGLAFVSALVAVAIGGFGLVLMVLGGDPATLLASPASMANGLGITAAFTAVYLLVIVALAAAPSPRTSISGAAA
jgi:hypothetical protein